MSQLVVLGPDLYNGTCGIALFLAAHAAVANSTSSKALAAAALSAAAGILRGRNPERLARLVGLGGGLGLGSIVTASRSSHAARRRRCARRCSRRGGVITADAHFSGSPARRPGWQRRRHLGLLRLYRQTRIRRCTRAGDQLREASACATPRRAPGQRSWTAPGSKPAQRHVARRGGLCLRFGVAGLGHRT